jgi:hypothetical protein
MNEIRVNTWEECEVEFQKIEHFNRNSFIPACFRGHADARWSLITTLERRTTAISSFLEYYRKMLVIKPAIETFTNSIWDMPEFAEIQKWVMSYDAHRDPNQKVLAYSYMAHLRHNGFPSPLLDWTRSPYIAAFFAFSKPQSGEVAIYAFAESPNNTKFGSSTEPQIQLLGQYVKTHRRHFRQQSRYTISAKFDMRDGWQFVPHDDVFDLNRTDQDVGWKIIVPTSEREKVMRILDRVNINEFSLFESEEGLMETLAVQEIDLRRRP